MITYLEGRHFPGIDGKIVIVVAKFNRTITDRLLDGALNVLKASGVEDNNIIVCRVPGAFEIPIVAKRAAGLSDTLAVICLGAVIKGETTHDQHINRAMSCELMQIGCKAGVPVIFGVLTCDTVEQALARAGDPALQKDKSQKAHTGNKGADAAEAALEMIHLLAQIPDSGPGFDEFASMFTQALMSSGSQGGGIFDSQFDYDDDYDEEDDDDEGDDFGCGDPDCDCHYFAPEPRRSKKNVSRKAVKKAKVKKAKKTTKKKKKN